MRTQRIQCERIAEYIDTIQDTKLWHGTGKFQYKNGEVTDIFTAIVEKGSLAPAHDVYSVLITGDEMISISTTTLRIIARAYADTHGKGEREPNRYGTALWWVAYYYSLFYGALYTRHSVTIIKNWGKWATAASQDGVIAWGKKVNAHAEYVWDVFGSGSDIPGNYPIIFGIAHHGQTAVLPKVLERAEVRITQPVPLKHISHLEVPEANVAEVTTLLKKHGHTIPVFPIELGEYVTSQQKFTDILGFSK